MLTYPLLHRGISLLLLVFYDPHGIHCHSIGGINLHLRGHHLIVRMAKSHDETQDPLSLICHQMWGISSQASKLGIVFINNQVWALLQLFNLAWSNQMNSLREEPVHKGLPELLPSIQIGSHRLTRHPRHPPIISLPF